MSAQVLARDMWALGKRGAQTRSALLKAAAVHLEATPWRQASMIAVARLAKVSPATAYQYFSGIEDLARTLAAEMRARGDRLPAHLKVVLLLLGWEERHLGAARDA